MYKAQANIFDGKNTVLKGQEISDTDYGKLVDRQKAKFKKVETAVKAKPENAG